MFMQKLSTSTQERLMSNQENTKTARISPHVKTQKPQNKRGIKEEASETAQSRQHQPDEAERTEDVSVLSRRLVLTSLVAAPAFVHGHHVGGGSQVTALLRLSPLGRSFSLCQPKCRRSAGALPAPASQPRCFRPYHLSNYSRGNFPPQTLPAASECWSAGCTENPPLFSAASA